MGGCSKDDNVLNPNPNPNPSGINIDLDLNSAEYSKLKTKGNFAQIQSSSIVVAYSTDGNYYAANLICPHDRGIIEFTSDNNSFHCTKHPEQYYSNKGVSNGARTSDTLKTYVCTLNDTKLNVKG
jgi:nitrite reductase/ring-hydroxylating ferredoxin subunit